MLAVRTPGAPQAARVGAAFGSAFPFTGQGRLLRSRSISGLFSRSLHSGLQPPCLRFAAAVTGRHARLGSRLLARLLPRPSSQTADFNALTRRNPHRSRRALLTHRAPPLGSGVEAVTRQRVYRSDWRKEAGDELDELLGPSAS